MRTIHVAHPVPVSLVPARARKPRLVHERRTTAVALAEAAPSEFEPVPFAPSRGLGRITPDETGRRLYARDGALWHRLVQPSGADLPVEAFLAFLSGSRAPTPDVERLYARTPLVAARTGEERGLHRVEATRGEAGFATGGRVLRDYGDEAEAGLRDFLGREVAIAGDAIHVRVPGPMAGQFRLMESPDLQMTLFPRWAARVSNFCRPADVAAFRAIQERCSLPETRIVGRPGVLVEGDGAAMLPPDLVGDPDLPLFAHCLAEELHGLADRPDPGIPALAERLRPMAVLGQVGLVPGGSVEDALTVLRAAVGELLDKGGFTPQRVWFARDFLDGIAFPRLAARAAREADGIDAEALAGLAPGR